MSKKVVLLVSVAFFIVALGFGMAQDKPAAFVAKPLVIVTIKLKVVSESYHKKVDVDEVIKKAFQPRQNDLQKEEKKIEEIEKVLNDPTINKRSLDYIKSRQDLEVRKLKFKHQFDLLKYELNEEQDKYAAAITDDIDEAIKDFAKTNKIDIVLRVREGEIGERTQVIYCSDIVDISEKVVDILNKKYEAGGKDVNKSLYPTVQK